MNSENHDLSRGGFQNRDVGRTLYDRGDYGPDHGIDFALYSVTNDLVADERLKEQVCGTLDDHFPGFCADLDVHVRNGFVFLKGAVLEEENKFEAENVAATVDGVIKVINVLEVRS